MALLQLLHDRLIPSPDLVHLRLSCRGITSVPLLQSSPPALLSSLFPEAAFCSATKFALQALCKIREEDPANDPTALPCWAVERLCRHPQWCDGSHLVEALHEIFEEDKVVATRLRAFSHPWLCWSFLSRCEAAGVPWLAFNSSKTSRTLSAPPQKTIKLAHEAVGTGRLIHLWPALQREAALRILVHKCAHSWRSVASGIHTFSLFCRLVKAREFPADEATVVSFSAIFRNGDTFANYIGHIITGHQMLLLQPTWDPALLRAIKVGSRKMTIRSTKALLRHREVQLLAARAQASESPSDAHLYAIAYHFLLRVPSELLPLRLATAPQPNVPPRQWHSFVTFGDSRGKRTATITLGVRKNHQSEVSSLLRSCMCSDSRDLACGVCSLYDLRDGITADSWTNTPFKQTPQLVLYRLRVHALLLNICGNAPVGTHAFRRGRASDLMGEGLPLATILQLGGWRSAAILHYLAVDELQSRLGSIQIIEGSESE